MCVLKPLKYTSVEYILVAYSKSISYQSDNRTISASSYCPLLLRQFILVLCIALTFSMAWMPENLHFNILKQFCLFM